MPAILHVILVVFVVVILSIALVMRDKMVQSFLLRMLDEEDRLKRRMLQNGMPVQIDSYPRYKTMPSYYYLVACFWIPLSHYEQPLSKFYGNNICQERFK